MRLVLAMRPALSTVAAAVLTAGCAVGPNYQRPDLPTPTAYQEIAPKAAAPLSQPLAAPVDEAQVQAWWKQFHDPVLDSLISRAMAGNLDLKTEVARIRQSREQEVISGAAGLPHATLGANALQLNDSSSSNVFQSLGQLTGRSIENEAPSRIDNVAAFTDATWEVDLFGRVRRGVEAARAGTEAAVWAKRDGQVSLAAEVATDYLQLRELQHQVAIANQEVARQKDILTITRQQAETGFVTRLNVNQQQAQVEQTIASIPNLEAQVRGQVHALGVLLGEAPEALTAELTPPSADPLPSPPQALPVGLPSDLLRRRPDVREAERQLAQATATVGQNVAQLYPRFNIIALGALASPTGAHLFDLNNGTSAGIGLIQWPVFQGGQIRGQIRSARAQEDQAYYGYQKTILTALRDVEDSLARYSSDQRRIEAQKAFVDASANSLQIARQQYETGMVTFLNVLQAEQTLLDAQNGLVQDQGQLAVDLASLYKALGGGWTADEGKLLQKAGVSSP
jgi:outer membrane protein, multidrug efflux system